MITHRTINGKQIKISVKFFRMGTIDWTASHDEQHITGGTTSDYNDLSEAIPEIVEMVEISLDTQDGNYNDVCSECGQTIPAHTDCPTCTRVSYDAADFAASARDWERETLRASQ